jgi:hypothetical protein
MGTYKENSYNMSHVRRVAILNDAAEGEVPSYSLLWLFPVPQSHKIHVGFEVLKAVLMKSSILWVIRAYSPLKIKRRFGAVCRIHLKGGGTNEAKNQHEAGRERALTVY